MRVPPTLRRLIGPLELIHEPAGFGLLRLTRWGVVTVWIVKLLLDPLTRLAGLPLEILQPLGVLALLPADALHALYTAPGLEILWWSTLVALVLSLSTRLFAPAATLAALLLTLYSSVIRGFGPAVHTDIVLLLAVDVLAAFAWADFFQARLGPRPPKTSAWSSYPLVTIVALLCLSYCLVGLNRAIAGGPRVFTGDTMEVWTIDAGLRGYYFNTNVGWRIPEWPAVVLLLRLGLPAITCFEITAPLCLVSPHYRWIFIPVMLSFHLLSLVFMNIFFFDDMLLYLLLIDWSRKYPALRARRS